MSDDLPKFKHLASEIAWNYIARVFAHSEDGRDSALLDLRAYPDGHFRAIFSGTYFTLSSEHGEPSKSQWNSLKKKLKRHHKGVFIFKEHGQTDCPPESNTTACYYLDFGFFAQ